MTSSLRLASAVALLALLASCTALKQYRTVTVKNPQTGEIADQICSKEAPNSSTDRCAVEHRTYTYEGAQHDYFFATVEFDDQGWFWDRRQMELLARTLYEYRDAAGKPTEYLIFTHAHGWQHNADACDNNVICFQRLLERLDVSERSFNREAPRKIVGVFVAWRGRSITIPKVSSTSFYSRKRVGSRVGIGGVTELLTRLKDFRDFKTSQSNGRPGTKTQLIISGHSFGGQVIYKALAQPLIERATRMSENPAKSTGANRPYGYEIAKSFGDLVILVNPAFEGSAYESLQFAATNRCYPPEERPVMMVVTSQTDDATRVAFPAGRAFSNLFSRSQCRDERETIFHTVGHLDRYQTHELRLKGVEPGSEREKKRKEGKCGCPYLGPIEEFKMQSEDAAFFADLDRVRAEKDGNDGKVYEMGAQESYGSVEEYRETSYGMDSKGQEMVLDRSPEYAANYPYLVISATSDFIPDHSSIYGERFTDFLRRFYFRHLVRRVNFPYQCFDKKTNPQCLDTDITPCDRSWTGRLAYGCGGALPVPASSSGN
jgi:hypothetical protein